MNTCPIGSKKYWKDLKKKIFFFISRTVKATVATASYYCACVPLLILVSFECNRHGLLFPLSILPRQSAGNDVWNTSRRFVTAVTPLCLHEASIINIHLKIYLHCYKPIIQKKSQLLFIVGHLIACKKKNNIFCKVQLPIEAVIVRC